MNVVSSQTRRAQEEPKNHRELIASKISLERVEEIIEALKSSDCLLGTSLTISPEDPPSLFMVYTEPISFVAKGIIAPHDLIHGQITIPEINRLLLERGKSALNDEEETVLFRANQAFESYIPGNTCGDVLELRIEKLNTPVAVYEALRHLESDQGIEAARIRLSEASGSEGRIAKWGLRNHQTSFFGTIAELREYITRRTHALEIDELKEEFRKYQPEFIYHFSRGVRCWTISSLDRLGELVSIEPVAFAKIFLEMISPDRRKRNIFNNGNDYDFLFLDESRKISKASPAFEQALSEVRQSCEGFQAGSVSGESLKTKYLKFLETYRASLPHFLREDDFTNFRYLRYTFAYMRNQDPKKCFDRLMKADIQYMGAFVAGYWDDKGRLNPGSFSMQESEKLLPLARKSVSPGVWSFVGSDNIADSNRIAVYTTSEGRVYQYLPVDWPPHEQLTEIFNALTDEADLLGALVVSVARVVTKLDYHNFVAARGLRSNPNLEQNAWIVSVSYEGGFEKSYYLDLIEPYTHYVPRFVEDGLERDFVEQTTLAQVDILHMIFEYMNQRSSGIKYAIPEQIVMQVGHEADARHEYFFREWVVAITPKDVLLSENELSEPHFQTLLMGLANLAPVSIFTSSERGLEDDIVVEGVGKNDEVIQFTMVKTDTKFDPDTLRFDFGSMTRRDFNPIGSVPLQAVLPAYLIFVRSLLAGSDLNGVESNIQNYIDCFAASVNQIHELHNKVVSEFTDSYDWKKYLDQFSGKGERGKGEDLYRDWIVAAWQDCDLAFRNVSADALAAKMKECIESQLEFFSALTSQISENHLKQTVIRKAAKLLSLVGNGNGDISQELVYAQVKSALEHDFFKAAEFSSYEQVTHVLNIVSTKCLLSVLNSAEHEGCLKIPKYTELLDAVLNRGRAEKAQKLIEMIRAGYPNLPISDEMLSDFLVSVRAMMGSAFTGLNSKGRGGEVVARLSTRGKGLQFLLNVGAFDSV